MARTTRGRKQAEAPKVDIGAEIFASLEELEKLKGIPVASSPPLRLLLRSSTQRPTLQSSRLPASFSATSAR